MLRYDERSHTNKHDQSGDDNTVLIRRQQFLFVCELIDKTVSNKYGVIVTLSKDKRGENNVDNIELHIEEIHDTQYPEPSHSHREEGQYA